MLLRVLTAVERREDCRHLGKRVVLWFRRSLWRVEQEASRSGFIAIWPRATAPLKDTLHLTADVTYRVPT